MFANPSARNSSSTRLPSTRPNPSLNNFFQSELMEALRHTLSTLLERACLGTSYSFAHLQVPVFNHSSFHRSGSMAAWCASSVHSWKGRSPRRRNIPQARVDGDMERFAFKHAMPSLAFAVLQALANIQPASDFPSTHHPSSVHRPSRIRHPASRR